MLSQKGRFSTAQNGDDVTRPQLTSLIDVMTILLVFLLQNFSTEGNLITPPDDIELAPSSAMVQPKENFTIQITPHALKIGGTTVLEVSSYSTSDSLLITPLFNALEKARNDLPDFINKKEIRIEADKSIPFSTLKRVMYTCNRAGLEDFSVLVLRKNI